MNLISTPGCLLYSWCVLFHISLSFTVSFVSSAQAHDVERPFSSNTLFNSLVSLRGIHIANGLQKTDGCLGSPRLSSSRCRRGSPRSISRMEGSQSSHEHGFFLRRFNWCAAVYCLSVLFLTTHRLAGTALGIALLITFAVSICAIVQRNHVTIGLVILNYTLLIDAIGIIIIGTFVWFYTLQERANFHVLWAKASPETRIILQDQVCSQTLANPLTTSSIC